MGRQKQYQKSTRVRLTDDEYRELTERAKRSGVSLSRLLVESTLADKGSRADQKRLTQDLIDHLDWAVTQVVRVGNNLNQVARQLNSQTGTISARRIEHVLNATLEAVTDLKQVLEHGAAD
jgi:hypothetical protein